jgi:glycosyltransferase involved in cell wall biosynthesis
MERYADELGAALRHSDRFAIRETTIGPSRWARTRPLHSLDRRLTRFRRYPRHLAAQRADLFHITDHSYADLAAALPLDRTIVTCHDLVLLRAETGAIGFRGPRTSTALFRSRVRFLADVAHVACISEQTRADVIELLDVPPDRTSVIPNGLDPRFEPAEPIDRRTWRRGLVRDDEQLLLHVSTGAIYKNVEGTLHILARLRAAGRRAVLVRAGRPLDAAQQRLAASLGLGDAVRDLGRVSDARLIELYNAADLLLFPSHYEGFGWPPLEAMACGTPVVISEAPALLEVCGDAALHAPAADSDALAAAAARLLDDSALRADLIDAGRRRAAGYTWQATAQAFEALYARLLGLEPRIEEARTAER